MCELFERCSVKEFRLFVFSKVIPPQLIRFEFWALIVPIKKILRSLRELSCAVYSLYSWINEWMPFSFVQHRAKSPLFPLLSYILPYAGQLLLLCLPEQNLHFMMTSGFGFWSRNLQCFRNLLIWIISEFCVKSWRSSNACFLDFSWKYNMNRNNIKKIPL